MFFSQKLYIRFLLLLYNIYKKMNIACQYVKKINKWLILNIKYIFFMFGKLLVNC